MHTEEAVPLDINVNDPTHLLGLVSLLDMRDEQKSAWQTLMAEIAERDDRFLPSTH